MNLQRKKNNTGRDLMTTMFQLPQAYQKIEPLRFASEAVTIRFQRPPPYFPKTDQKILAMIASKWEEENPGALT
jgi:hypothetical protein